jgi:hypothetical protein
MCGLSVCLALHDALPVDHAFAIKDMVSLGRRDGRVGPDAQEHAAQVRWECPCYDARLLSVVLLEHRLPRAHQISVAGVVRGSAHLLV